MQGKLFRQQYFYITGLMLLVCGLPLSYFLMSLSQFFLAASFFLEGNPADKWRRFMSNRYAVAFAGIWLMHLIGMLWTSDQAEGIHDLRIKLPLLILPLIIGGTLPLKRKQYHLILLTFVAAVLIASFVIFAVLTGIIYRPYHDIHEVFIFKISHIRFALFVCLAIFILLYLAFKEYGSSGFKITAVAIVLWFIFFQIKVQAITGLVILLTTGIFLLIQQVFRFSSKPVKIISAILIVGLPILIVTQVKTIYHSLTVHHPYTFSENDTTALGSKYTFDRNDPLYENGYKLNLYVAREELQAAWNKRSKLNFDSLDARSQKVNATLIRYLTSKGLRKDAESLSKLSDAEVHAIENGVANVEYMRPGLKARLKQIIWEFEQYKNGGNPSGHSVTQRLEFWKAAFGIIRQHFFTGTGTGDLKEAYKTQYDSMHSKLDESHRLRAHNQYLSIFAAFGIFGFIYFLYGMVFPFFSVRHNFLFMVFMSILLLSMLTEDTLETQPGATFAALFFCLFLFAATEKSGESSAQSLSVKSR